MTPPSRELRTPAYETYTQFCLLTDSLLWSDVAGWIFLKHWSESSVQTPNMFNWGDFVMGMIAEECGSVVLVLKRFVFFVLWHCVKSYSFCLIGSGRSLRLIKLSSFAPRLVRNPLKKIASNSTSCWAEVWELHFIQTELTACCWRTEDLQTDSTVFVVYKTLFWDTAAHMWWCGFWKCIAEFARIIKLMCKWMYFGYCTTYYFSFELMLKCLKSFW